VIGLLVARLGLCLDARGTGLYLTPPPAHAKFLKIEEGIENPLSVKGKLVLRIRNEPSRAAKIEEAPLCRFKNWELWLDELGRYIFVAPRQSPPLRIVIEPGFKTGEVLGDFSLSVGADFYPLQNLEIKLFVNWLASFGDTILHASGVVVNRKGYAFIGPAGAGKSTLAASLSTDQSIMVLGEDQVILRYMEGCFWIYGTPWHQNPAMCSPDGAPLEKLFFLDRNAQRGVETLTPLDGITRLLQTAFIPYYRPELVSNILDRLTILAERIQFYSLSYQLGSDVWKLIRAA
jgi:hypothetical protein